MTFWAASGAPGLFEGEVGDQVGVPAGLQWLDIVVSNDFDPL